VRFFDTFEPSFADSSLLLSEWLELTNEPFEAVLLGTVLPQAVSAYGIAAVTEMAITVWINLLGRRIYFTPSRASLFALIV
jgi:hypothetical protein